MKALTLLLACFVLLAFDNGDKKVESRVYALSGGPADNKNEGEKRQVLKGSTRHCKNFEIIALPLEPGKKTLVGQGYKGHEHLVVVRSGNLNISFENRTKAMGPGSVAVVLPGDKVELENNESSTANYFLIKYKSHMPPDNVRGKNSGGSQLISWDELEFKPHDKGGVRPYFNRKSAMSERIEMHVTTLNPGIKSHEPHTHIPGEIIIMMEGTTEMEIGDSIYPGTAGDIYFMGSNVPHAIKNTSTEDCMYMAFQWK